MHRKLNFFLVCLVICYPLFAHALQIMIPAGPPAGHKAIWILGPDGKLSEYDGADFHLWMKTPSLPRDARNHPGNISISSAGQAVYAETLQGTSLRRFWSTNNYAREMTAGAADTRPTKDGAIVTSATPTLFFSADGQHLFWFENRLSVVQRENHGDISQTGEFLAWTSNLTGRDPKPLVTVKLAPCKCGTGVCEETCPEIRVWAPAAGISDFFYLTRFISGQTSEEDLETELYQAVNGVWTAHKLPLPLVDQRGERKLYASVYSFLDATRHGNTYIAAIPDAGCCGWDNESNDTTYLVRGAKQAPLFDERARFHNKDYDVSFLTSKALFSQGATEIAYTITASARPGQEIRLADEGKSNPEELRHIQGAIGKLPRVEVVGLTDLLKPRFSLENTELIGWLNDQRLLVWRQGQLFVINAANGQSTPTGLKAEKAAYVFIR